MYRACHEYHQPPTTNYQQSTLFAISSFSLHMSIQNKIIVITAPSGSGKTSITRHLMKVFPDLAFSISAATRQSRGTEKNEVDYYFISENDFKQKIQHSEFVEWEMVYEGKYYGTLKSELQRIWDQQKVPVLDIDVKGAIHVKQQYPDSCITLFIEPPSVVELKKRLETRGTETAESLAARINKAAYELSFKEHFDKVIVNDNLEKACTEATSIIKDFLQG
ncbi:MAG: guanylate kinase [Ferruginibacter sp.]